LIVAVCDLPLASPLAFCHSLRSPPKRRGGLGLVNIKTMARNGSVIGIYRVRNGDEVMMITARGQISAVCGNRS